MKKFFVEIKEIKSVDVIVEANSEEEVQKYFEESSITEDGWLNPEESKEVSVFEDISDEEPTERLENGVLYTLEEDSEEENENKT